MNRAASGKRRLVGLALVLACMLGTPASGSPASDTDGFERVMAEAAEAERRHDPLAALELYRRAEAQRPDDAFVLQKIAQQLSDSLILEPNSPAARSRMEEALSYARRAVDADPASAVNQLSLAILYGRLATDAGPSEKIEYARLVRHHAEEALVRDPGYAWACHVLGRWHLEVAALGTARRAVAALFFGTLPKASKAEGLRLLERAVALEPEAVVHRVELGNAYERLGRGAEARVQWERALTLPVGAVYDEAARTQAAAALATRGKGG